MKDIRSQLTSKMLLSSDISLTRTLSILYTFQPFPNFWLHIVAKNPLNKQSISSTEILFEPPEGPEKRQLD